MTPLRQRLIEDLQLHGLSAKTQDAYLRAVKDLAEHYHTSPDLITEEELRRYLLYLTNEKHASPSPDTPSSFSSPSATITRHRVRCPAGGQLMQRQSLLPPHGRSPL